MIFILYNHIIGTKNFMTEPIVNLDVLTTVFEFCRLRDGRNMGSVSNAFRRAYESSRTACSIRGMGRVRRLFRDHKHGATKVFKSMNDNSMVVETRHVRGDGELSYYMWHSGDYAYETLTYPVEVDGTINHARWKSGFLRIVRY